MIMKNIISLFNKNDSCSFYSLKSVSSDIILIINRALYGLYNFASYQYKQSSMKFFVLFF